MLGTGQTECFPPTNMFHASAHLDKFRQLLGKFNRLWIRLSWITGATFLAQVRWGKLSGGDLWLWRGIIKMMRPQPLVVNSAGIIPAIWGLLIQTVSFCLLTGKKT